MKPFNLEEAKAGAPVITRDGRAVRIVCFDRACPHYPIVALIGGAGEEDVQTFTNGGMYYADEDGGYADCDLFMAPVQRTVWVNLYAGGLGGPFTSDTTYESEYLAKRGVCGSWAYIGTFPITYEE